MWYNVKKGSENCEEFNMYYNRRWLRNATDDELKTEREKVRLQYVDAANERESVTLYNLLSRFDDEMIIRMNRKYDEEHPNAKPRHREHGWYLPNDD